MTAFVVGCLLIYQTKGPWWWYMMVAFATWADAHYLTETFKALFNRIEMLERRLSNSDDD